MVYIKNIVERENSLNSERNALAESNSQKKERHSGDGYEKDTPLRALIGKEKISY